MRTNELPLHPPDLVDKVVTNYINIFIQVPSLIDTNIYLTTIKLSFMLKKTTSCCHFAILVTNNIKNNKVLIAFMILSENFMWSPEANKAIAIRKTLYIRQKVITSNQITHKMMLKWYTDFMNVYELSSWYTIEVMRVKTWLQ